MCRKRASTLLSITSMFDLSEIADALRSHKAFIPPACFVAALLGSLLGTNLVVPTGVILAAVGVLVGAGIVSWTTVVWAALGAVVGCSASFSIGLWLGERLKHISARRSWVNAVARAETLFDKHGYAAVAIGYFCGPARAPVAAIAAIAGMQRRKFELANLFSAFAWATVAIGVGVLPGTLIEPGSSLILLGPLLIPLLTLFVTFLALAVRKITR
jgi:membrane-associated protein